MAAISVRGLTKSYGSFPALHGLDLEIPSGQFVALLGPSGSGKTTALRCLAGLETPDDGELRIGEQTVAAPRHRIFIPPDRRRVGLVFQNYALWPHMTVADTVGYPLKVQRTPPAARRQRVAELLGLVGMAELGDRRCAQLSGGQQQRVALARALANDSTVMLFDEPLSNLDARLRIATRSAIRDVHRRVGATSVYVTHDQEEALALADRVVVMSEGKVQQDADPVSLYQRPRSLFVARFLGVENLLAGRVVATDAGGRLLVDVPGFGEVEASWQAGETGPAVGAGVTLAARATDVLVDDVTEAGSQKVARGVVTEVVYSGEWWALAVELAGRSAPTLHARVPAAGRRTPVPVIGDLVDVAMRAGAPLALAGSQVAVDREEVPA